MNDLQRIVSRLYRFADWVQKRSRTGGIKAEREGSAPKYGAAARKVLGLDKKSPAPSAPKSNAKQHWGTEKQPYWRPGRNPTVDNVITRDNPETGEREILLIQRATKDKKGNPVAEGGELALPGGFWDTKAGKGESWRNDHESDDEAALRELLEETRLDASELKKAMKKVGTYETGPNAKVRRDPRDNSEAWSQSTAFRLHLTPDMAKRSIAGSDDASDAKWVPVSKIWNMKLAFDHGQIIKEALGSGSGVPFPPNLKTIKGVSDHIWELSIHGGRKKSPNDYRWDITSGDVTRTINALRSQNPSLQEIEAIARRIGVSTTNASRMGLWGPRDHKDGLIDRIEVALRGLIQGWPGPSGPPPREKSPKEISASQDAKLKDALDLFNYATDPRVTVDHIESVLADLAELDPPMKKLQSLLGAMGSVMKFTKKAGAMKAIRHKILGRKGSFDRVNA
jgi:ADP-ribose pyrophosphatase YjhB (NUDIX family)